MLEITYRWPRPGSVKPLKKYNPSIRKSGIKFVASVIGSDRKLNLRPGIKTATLVKHLMRIYLEGPPRGRAASWILLALVTELYKN